MHCCGAILIKIKLRDAIAAHKKKTGRRLTYAELSKGTGMSRDTLASIASRPSYNATMKTVDKLCIALNCTPGELLCFTRLTPRRAKQ